MSLNMTPEQHLMTIRRLALSKELYNHGSEHSTKKSRLNSIIGVHNMHSALEIAIRAIVTHYKIDNKPKDKRDHSFEDLMNLVDNYPQFKDANPRILLPYRQEIRRLNTARNTAQHDAIEPASTAIDEIRVFTKAALEEICNTYFKLDFHTLSSVDLIDDSRLQTLLKLPLTMLTPDHFKDSLAITKFAFDWAKESLESLTPQGELSYDDFEFRFRSRLGFAGQGILDRKLEQSVEDAIVELHKMLMTRIREVADYASLLSSGLDISDYKRFRSISPQIFLHMYRIEELGATWGKHSPTVEDAEWAHSFVTELILRWQTQGLKPTIEPKNEDEQNWLDHFLVEPKIKHS